MSLSELVSGNRIARVLPVVVLITTGMQVGGCYYMQAMRGQLEVLHAREPIDEIIADAESSPDLRHRLALVQEARDFAVSELLLPDNDSYRTYADLERDYVVWNVFAAPEFSLEPQTWCYPVAGCVAYRGYFSEDSARSRAAKLEEDGFDVMVGGVPAYSTLGRFDDPVLNTMMRWSDTQLVSTIFHELAHQRLYVKGDTAFNESYASAVADFGIERWLPARNEQEGIETYRNRRALRREVTELVEDAKVGLTALYAKDMDVTTKRERKRQLLDVLASSVKRQIDESGTGARNWLAAPLNNARLVSVGLYDRWFESFRTILRICEFDLACFYDETERLAALQPEQREKELERQARIIHE